MSPYFERIVQMHWGSYLSVEGVPTGFRQDSPVWTVEFAIFIYSTYGLAGLVVAELEAVSDFGL